MEIPGSEATKLNTRTENREHTGQRGEVAVARKEQERSPSTLYIVIYTLCAIYKQQETIN